MPYRLLSNTKILSFTETSAKLLTDAITFLAPGPVALIVDPTPQKTRDALLKELAPHNYRTLNQVRPNPQVSDIMAMTEQLRHDNIAVVVGIGGGSTLDSAKAVAVMLANEGDLEEYLGSGARQLAGRQVKLLLIPTTAGTGAEVTKFGVYTARSGRKYTLNSAFLQADGALLFADLTYTLPPAITAATAMDALSHGLEALWNRNATARSDQAAMDALVEIFKVIETVYASAQRGETAGRMAMLQAATAAGVAFNCTGTALCHSLSFILSEVWHLPHGSACGLTLDSVLEVNAADPEVKAKLSALAQRLFPEIDAHKEGIATLTAKIRSLRSQLGLPANFRDIGASMPIDELVKLFLPALDDPKTKNNPGVVTAATLRGILASKL